MQENKKNVLGKGLSELISETTAAFSDDENDVGGTVAFLPLNQIVFNPKQPRKNIDLTELDELATSIKEHGILQPIIVRKVDSNIYQIVAGERRCHAARKAGLMEIPALIKKYTECDALEVGIIENIQRKELNSLEEAEAYCKLVEEHAHTQESLARRLGKSRSHIANTMRLSKLPDEVKALLQQNKLSAGHGRAIASSQNPVELARAIVENNLNVRETEKLIKKLLNQQGGKQAIAKNIDKVQDVDLKELERQLGSTLKMKVQMKCVHGTYRVIVHCKDLDEFDLVIAKLNSDTIF